MQTRKYVSILLLAIAIVVCNVALAAGTSADAVTRPLGAFNKIKFEGGYEVTLVQDKSEAITIETANDKLNYVKTEVVNGLLVVRVSDDFQYYRVKLTIHLKNIESIEISGGVKINASGTIACKQLTIDVQGGSDIQLKLEGESLSAELSGGSNMELEGHVNNLNITLNGAGRIEAGKLVSEKVKAEINGAGYISVFASMQIDAAVNGLGSILYAGNPAKVKSSIGGLGSIKEK